MADIDKNIDKVKKLNEQLEKTAKLTKEADNSFFSNQVSAVNELKSTIKYAKELTKLNKEVVSLILPDEKLSKADNLVTFARTDTKAKLAPYGLNVRPKTKDDTDKVGSVIYKDMLYEIDKDKVINEEHRKALLNLIKQIQEFKLLSKEVGSTGAINRTTPRKFLSANGDIYPEYKDIVRRAPKGTKIDDVNTFSASYKDNEGNTISGIFEVIKQAANESQLVYDKNNYERLHGFEDEKGEHLGYIDIVKRLEDVSNSIIKSTASIGGLTQSEIGSTFSVYSYDTPDEKALKDYIGYKLNDSGEAATREQLADIASYSIIESDIVNAIRSANIVIPFTSGDSKYDAYNNRKIGDKLRGDSLDYIEADAEYYAAAKYNADKYTAQITENMSEAERQTAELSADVKSMLSGYFKTAYGVKELYFDREERSEDGYVWNSADLKSNTRTKGNVNPWSNAKTAITELDSLMEEVKSNMSYIENKVKGGDILGLNEEDAAGYKNVDYLNRSIKNYTVALENFDKGKYAETSEKTGMYDRDKYTGFFDTFEKWAKKLYQSADFSDLGGAGQVVELTKQKEAIDKVKAEANLKNAFKNFKADYIKAQLNKEMLPSEIATRQKAADSGLLGASEVEKDIEKISKLNKKLELTEENILELKDEAAGSGFDTTHLDELANSLVENYKNIANILGSKDLADKFITNITSKGSINENTLAQVLGNPDFSKLEEYAGQTGLDTLIEQLREMKNYTSDLNFGQFERDLKGRIVNEKGIAGKELSGVQYQNKVYNQLLADAESTGTGGYGVNLDSTFKSFADMGTFINELNKQVSGASTSIEELGNTEFSGEILTQLGRLKSTLLGVNKDFSDIVNELPEDATIAQMKKAFDAAQNVKLASDRLALSIEDVAVKGKEASQLKQYNQEKELNRRNFENVKNHFPAIEAETGTKVPLVDQIEYYKKAVEQFKHGSNEYIEVLKLLRKAEADYKTESNNNWNKISNTIQSVSNFINKSINKIVSAIRTGFNIIKSVITGTIKVIKGIKDTITRLLTLFGSFGNRLKQAFGLGTSGSYNTNKAFNTLKMTSTELYHKILLIKNGFEQLFNNQLIQKASELYGAVYALKTVTNNKITTDTINWANKLEHAFGLSAKDLIADISEVNTLIRGLGMSEQDSSLASKNLVMIGNHLAAIGHYGGNVEGVQTAIISGLKGETEAIDNLGISVRASEMNTFLESMRKQGGEFANIGKRFEDLNEEARVYVRYAAIIKQYTDVYSMDEYANSLETVTGRVGLLKQSFSSLGTTIGQVFLKMLAGVAKYLTVFIKYLEDKVNTLADYISNRFNIDLDINVSDKMNGGADAAKNLNKNLDKTKEKLEDINNTADGGLYSFDTVEGMGSDSGESGKGLDDTFDYSKLMTSALEGLDKKANEATESYFDKLKREVKESMSSWKTQFNKFVNEATGRKIDLSFGFDKGKAKGDIDEIVSNIKGAFLNLRDLLVDVGARILDDTKAGRILNSVIELVKDFTNMLKELFKTLKIVFDYFYDSHLSIFFKELGIDINNSVKGVTANIRAITKSLKELQEAFSDPNAKDKDSMLNMLYEKYPVLKHIIEIIKNLVGIVGELYRNVIKPLLKDLEKFMSSEFLPWLNEKLAQLRGWVSKNSDKLKEFAKILGGELWKYFKIFVELVAKLIDFVVKHPNEVVGFLKALVAIKFATWLTGGVIGLTKFVKGWKEFAGIFKGTKDVVDGVKKVSALSKVSSGVKAAGGKALTGSKALLGGAGSLVKGSGILSGAGATTASGIALTGAMGAVGAGMGIRDAYKLNKRRNEMFGAEEGNTMSAGLSTAVGGFIGGNHGGLSDEIDSAGTKAENVAMNALKGAALGGAIGSVIPGVGNAIGVAVGGVVGTITGAIGGENIAKAINGAWEGIKGFVGRQFNNIKDAATATGGWIKDRFVDAKNWVSDSADKAANAWENIQPKFRRAVDNIGGMFRGLWSSISPMLSKVGDFLFGENDIKIKAVPSLDYNVKKDKNTNNVVNMINGRLELLEKNNVTGNQKANNAEFIRDMAKSNYDAVYKAFLEVVNKTGGFGDTINNFDIGKGGINVVDERGWKLIANKVDPYLSTRGKNGTNSGFVLGNR